MMSIKLYIKIIIKKTTILPIIPNIKTSSCLKNFYINNYY